MAEENKVAVKAEKKAVKQNKKPSLFSRLGSFFKGMRSELKKVTWPSASTTVKNTAVVIAVVVASGIFVGLIDALFKWLVNLLAI